MFSLTRGRRSQGNRSGEIGDRRIRAAVEGLEVRTLFSALVWSSGPALPAALGNSSTTNWYGTILVAGGTNAAGAASSSVYGYDPYAGQWKSEPALDQARSGAGIGATGSNGPVVNNQYKYTSDVFVFGGQTSSVINYDPSVGGEGTAGAPAMSVSRSSLAYATDPATGQLYAIGGLNGSTALASAERYDPAADSWSAIAPLPQAVYSAAAVADGVGHLFIIGGDNSSGQALSTVYRYTIATDSWDTMSSMPFAASSVGAVDAAYGQIYVAGGQTSAGATANVEWYNPVLDQWNAETSLPTSVYGAAVTIDYNGNVDVIGGFNSAGKAVSSFYTSPVGPAPVGLPTTPTISFDTTYSVYNGQPVVVTPTVYATDGYTPVNGTFTLTYDGSTTPPTNAGTYTLVSTFTSADPAYTSTAIQSSLYIAQATPVVSLTGGGTITYDGNPHPVTASTVGVDGVTPVDGTFSYTYNGSTAAPVNPGSYAVVATFTSNDPNYAGTSATTNIVIPDPTIPTGVKGAGASQTSVTISWNAVAVPVSGYNVYERHVLHSPKGSGSTIYYTLVASTTGTSVTLNVGAQIAPHTYAVSSVSPTGVVSPRSALVGAEVTYAPSISGLLINGGYQSYPSIEAGQTLTATIAAFGNEFPTFQMLSGPSTMSVNPTTGVITYSPTAAEVGYNSATFQATNSVSSVTATFTFHVLGIPTVVVTGGTFAFDGNTHGATAVAYASDGVTPITGNFSFLYNAVSTAPYAMAGTWSVLATFTSTDPNYGVASGTSTIVINPATPTLTLTGGTITFDGAPHPAGASVVGVDGATPVYGNLAITYNGSATAPTAPGTYNVAATFTSSDVDYTNVSATTTLTIAPIVTQITPSIVISNDTLTYNGAAQGVIATAFAGDGVTPVGGAYTISYDGSSTVPTNAGVYNVGVSFTSNDPNFTDATAAGTLTIFAATPTMTTNGGTFTYNGAAQSATSSVIGVDGVTPVAGAVGYTYYSYSTGNPTTPTNADTYYVEATFVSSDPNYADTGATSTMVINRATPSIVINAGPFAYDDTAHAASATPVGVDGVTPVAGTTSITYNNSAIAPTNAGTYTVSAKFTSIDSNYNNAANTATLTINKVASVFSGLSSPTITVGAASTVISGVLTAGSFYPAGSVSITLNGVRQTATLGASGAFTSTFNTASLAANTYTISFSYAGSTNFAAAAAGSVLTVNAIAPIVTAAPVSQTVLAGKTVTFTSAASGNPTPAVQWQVSTDGGATFTNISGATKTTYSFTAVATQNGNMYRAVFTNKAGSATTTAAALTVQSAPAVTTAPKSQTIVAGASVTFTAAASGNPVPTVQWQLSSNSGTTWASIAGATNTSLTFSAAASQNGYRYRAVFTSSVGTATSASATLTVNSAPVVTVNPLSQTVLLGKKATFTASATGTPNPTVQWQLSISGGTTWTNISGATSTTYSFTVSLSQNGYWYRALFTNSVGTTASLAAVLTA